MKKVDSSLRLAVASLALLALLLFYGMFENKQLFFALVISGILAGVLLYRYYGLMGKKETEKVRDAIRVAAGGGEETLREVVPTVSGVTFRQVAGLDEVKEELFEIIDYFKNPKKYRQFGVHLPKGLLLVGPPGVGKTLVAKAVAGEAGVPFFYQSGSGFVHMYVGTGARRVRELFAAAKKNAPAVVFIDEIDAVGKKRGGERSDEREATLNQLLTEMDGFEESRGIVVIAATNKAEMLDEALLRPGRFDRRVTIGLPNVEERKGIIAVHLDNRPHKVSAEQVAEMTVGFSGAALASLVNEAAANALKHGRQAIGEEDFLAVKEKVIHGRRKPELLSPEQRSLLARYQAAKGTVAAALGLEFEKVTLSVETPRFAVGPFTSRRELLAMAAVHQAGKLLLEKEDDPRLFGAGDLERAEELALRYEKAFDPSGVRNAGWVVKQAAEEALKTLDRNPERLDALAARLLEQETVYRHEIL